jgi:Fur family peroxide stress response transcriptional regulator
MTSRMDATLVETLLRDRGCALTPQRRAVLRFLEQSLAHPTAGEVFEAITRDFPISSRATIYNTLALLEEVGAVRVVRLTDGDVRYDPNTVPHHHLACTKCGGLEDIAAEEVTVLRNGQPVTGQVRFEGVCARCG